MLKFTQFETTIGEIGLIWNENTQLLKQVILPNARTGKTNTTRIKYQELETQTKPPEYISNVMSLIEKLIHGKNINIPIDLLDFNETTNFQKQVLNQQRKIPHAKVTTYKQIARQINKPRSIRPTANALANNKFPLIMPCHRTVKSDWTLGGYAGNKEGHIKQILLENEGIKIENGKIHEKYRYSPTTIRY